MKKFIRFQEIPEVVEYRDLVEADSLEAAVRGRYTVLRELNAVHTGEQRDSHTCQTYFDPCEDDFVEEEETTVEQLQAEIARLKALTQWQPIETAPKYRGEILARDIHDAIWLVLWEEDRWVTLTPVGIANIEIPDLVDYILIPELPEPPEVTP